MALKSAGLIIVIFIIISAVVTMIMPEGSISKSLKFIVALGFISVMVFCICNIKLDKNLVDFDINSSYETTGNDMYDQTLTLAEQILEKKIVEELRYKSIEIDSVKINMDILPDGSIVIIDTVYSCNSWCDQEIIRDIIIKITGCDSIERY